MGARGSARATASASTRALEHAGSPEAVYHAAASAPPGRLALGLAALPFALHLAALTHYGFFRDELYFIVCGRHPAFGYADAPPLFPLLAAASQSAGESLWLLRIIPALFHVGAVLAACAIVRLLGGRRGAQIQYGLWGPRGAHPVLIIVGGDSARYERAFRDVRLAQVVHSSDAMPYESDLPIFVAREPRADLQTIWPRVRFLE